MKIGHKKKLMAFKTLLIFGELQTASNVISDIKKEIDNEKIAAKEKFTSTFPGKCLMN